MAKTKTKNVLVPCVALAAVFAAAVFKAPSAGAAAASTLYFNPASASVAVNADFTLDAMINPGTNAVSAVELHVTFDQTKLRLDSITPSSTFSLELMGASINNTNGTASIALAVPLTNPSITATSAIATFAFHSLAAATNSPVAFTNASMAAADSEPGNAIAARTPATVTVTAGGGGGGDTTAPVRSGGSPSGALTAGTTQAAVSLATDENATCKYAATAGTAYASMGNTFTTTGGQAHSFTATGLANGGSYVYYVRCQDASSNANTSDYPISFSVASSAVAQPDPVAPPVIASPKLYDSSNKRKSFSTTLKSKTVTFKGADAALAGATVRIESKTDKLLATTIADAQGAWIKKFKATESIRIRYLNPDGTELSVSKTYKLKFNTDKEKPEFTDLPESLAKKRGETLWWKAEDNRKVKYYTYKIGSKTRKTTKDSFVVPSDISIGTHVVKITAYDSAGNKASRSVTVTIR